MTIGEIEGLLAVLGVIAGIGIWLFKRGADVGSFSLKFDQQRAAIVALQRKIEAAEKCIKSLEDGDKKEGGIPWTVNLLKEKLKELASTVASANRETNMSLDEIRTEVNKFRAEVKASSSLSESAADLYEILREESALEHGKTQGQIILLAKQIRAIIEHLNTNVRQGQAKKLAGESCIMKKVEDQ